jgi:hypothetical protein
MHPKKGKLMARSGSFSGSVYIVVDHILSEKEEDAKYEIALRSLPQWGLALSFPSTSRAPPTLKSI